MRAPISWIAEYAGLAEDLSPLTLREQLIGTGLEVEQIDPVGADVSGPVVIGRVISFTPEPQKNGKTIRWCAVDVGSYNDTSEVTDGGPRGIVCGADNFAEGDLVAVALPGAVLPGDFAIAARKTYGHVSDGMICSASELGLGGDHGGILVLDPVDSDGRPRELGASVVESLELRDDVLDIAVTPDMSYCLSIRGIAREAALANNARFTDPVAVSLPAPGDGPQAVRLETPKAPLYTMLTVEGVDPNRASPQLITRRLQMAGIRPISLIVDVTNYVMLEIGVPLHAFDAERVRGAIVVREAVDGETLLTLDGSTRALVAGDLLITDDSGPIGLAGVMGGQSTEITDASSTVLLEAAWLDPIQIGRTSRRLRLVSEASKRFERYVDPQATYAAAVRAADLLVRYGGGTVGATTVVGAAPILPGQSIDPQLPSRILGDAISTPWVIETLRASGVIVDPSDDDTLLALQPPSWRPDLIDPFDYVEEVGAKWGFNKIPSVVPRAPGGAGLTRTQQARRAVNRAAAAAGFVEVLTFPFASAEDLDRLGVPAQDPRRDQVGLLNPLSEVSDRLRTTMLPGLFAAVSRNTSRSQDDLALFESGAVFFGADRPSAPTPGVAGRPSPDELAALEAALPAQPWHLAAVLTGQWVPAGWQGPGAAVGWQQALAFTEAVAGALGVALRRVAAEQAPWHPGRCAALMVDQVVVGWAGELHPTVIEAFGLPERTSATEIDLSLLIRLAPGPGQVQSLSTHPVVKEDVALVVDQDTPTAVVEQALVDGAGDLLESIRLFDIYRSEQLGEGKKSLAYSLRFRAPDRTLTEAEASAARDAAVAVAAERVGAVQRA